MNQDLKLAFEAYANGERDLAHAMFDDMAEAYTKGDASFLSESTNLYRPTHSLGRAPGRGYAGPQVKPTPVRNPQVQQPFPGAGEDNNGEASRLTSVPYAGVDAAGAPAPVGSLPPAQASAGDDWDFGAATSPNARRGIAGIRSESSASGDDGDGEDDDELADSGVAPNPAAPETVPVVKKDEPADDSVDLERSESAFPNKGAKKKDDKADSDAKDDNDVLPIKEIVNSEKIVRDNGRMPVSRSDEDDDALEDVGDEAGEEEDADGDELDADLYSQKVPEEQGADDVDSATTGDDPDLMEEA